MNVFIIIAAYNEGEKIRQTIKPLLLKKYNVVIVDDGSTDDTFENIKDLDLFYLKHEINLGQGAALQTGMKFALEEGADILVHFDADGQHKSKEIDKIIQPIIEKKVDVTLGSRFLRIEDINMIPRERRILLKVAVLVNKVFSGIKLSDAHNGFRAFSRNAALKINLVENRMAHATEILKKIKNLKLTYCEIPTNISYTDYSSAKGQSSWNSINILFQLIINSIIK